MHIFFFPIRIYIQKYQTFYESTYQLQKNMKMITLETCVGPGEAFFSYSELLAANIDRWTMPPQCTSDRRQLSEL